MSNAPAVISIIFSFRNEELVLEELIARTERVFQTLPYEYELLFVNDASTDRSMEILLAARKRNPRIRILEMSRRFGVAPCFMAGFDHARGDAAIMLDSDLQDPPELIPQLLTKWKEGARVVHTVRTKRKGESFLRLAVTALGYRIWKLLIPVDLILDSGDFRLLSKEAVRETVKHRDQNPFFRGITRSLGGKQDIVFYERDKRYAGKTHFSMIFSAEPLKQFLSVIISYRIRKLSIPDMLYSIKEKYGFPDLPDGPLRT